MATQDVQPPTPPPPSAAAPAVIHGTLYEGLERRMLEAAVPQLGGETPLVIYRGTTGMPFWLQLLLLIPLNILLLLVIAPLTIRVRFVVVTDRAVHIFQTKGMSNRLRRKVAAYPRPADVELTRFSLRVGGERKVYAGFGAFGTMKKAAELAEKPPA